MISAFEITFEDLILPVTLLNFIFTQ